MIWYVTRQEGHPAWKKTEWWGAGVVICLQQGADLHMAQLMPLPHTVSCFSKIQIGFTFLVPTHPGSPRKHTHTHTRLTTLCPGLPRWAGTRKVKPIWILLTQETVSGSGISWAIIMQVCTSLQTDNHTSTSLLSFFYRPDALPAAQPTASKHWRFLSRTKGR